MTLHEIKAAIGHGAIRKGILYTKLIGYPARFREDADNVYISFSVGGEPWEPWQTSPKADFPAVFEYWLGK